MFSQDQPHDIYKSVEHGHGIRDPWGNGSHGSRHGPSDESMGNGSAFWRNPGVLPCNRPNALRRRACTGRRTCSWARSGCAGEESKYCSFGVLCAGRLGITWSRVIAFDLSICSTSTDRRQLIALPMVYSCPGSMPIPQVSGGHGPRGRMDPCVTREVFPSPPLEKSLLTEHKDQALSF